MLDARTIQPSDMSNYDLVEGGDSVERRRRGQNLSLHYSARHNWSYYPRMTCDEASVTYTYDGCRPDEPRFTFHAAFDPAESLEPVVADAPPRRAMIVRCVGLCGLLRVRETVVRVVLCFGATKLVISIKGVPMF